MAENYKNESMVDVAYSVLSEKNTETSFKDLYKEICEKLGLSDDEAKAKIASFYTDLTLDGRFVNLGNNTWDLRENQSYDKVHIDMNDVYSDIDEESEGNLDPDEIDEDEKAEVTDDVDGDAEGDEKDGEDDYDSTKDE
jgi:DNA-directed RNA polymerase subunit delta